MEPILTAHLGQAQHGCQHSAAERGEARTAGRVAEFDGRAVMRQQAGCQPLQVQQQIIHSACLPAADTHLLCSFLCVCLLRRTCLAFLKMGCCPETVGLQGASTPPALQRYTSPCEQSHGSRRLVVQPKAVSAHLTIARAGRGLQRGERRGQCARGVRLHGGVPCAAGRRQQRGRHARAAAAEHLRDCVTQLPQSRLHLPQCQQFTQCALLNGRWPLNCLPLVPFLYCRQRSQDHQGAALHYSFSIN